MRRYLAAASVVTVIALSGVPPQTYAVSLTVNIGGTILTGTDSINVSTSNGGTITYGSITIEGVASQPARVIAGAGTPGGGDATNDSLSLVNARIRPAPGATLPFQTEYPISIRGIFSHPPTVTQANGMDMYYRVSGNGTFTRGAAGSPSYPTVRARGMIGTSLDAQSNPQVWTQITNTDLSKTCVVIACGTFFASPNMLNRLFPPPDVSGSRVLKGELWVKFTRSGDVITLNATNGLVVDHTTPGGPPGDEEPDAFWVPQKQYMEKRCKEKYCRQ